MKNDKMLLQRIAASFGAILLAAALLFGGLPVPAHAEQTYEIRVFSGNRGTFAGGNPFKIVVPKSNTTWYSLYDLPLDNNVDERYVVAGFRVSGTDSIVTGFTASEDRDFVVAYAVASDTANYVVRHLEYGTDNVLADEETFVGKLGSVMDSSGVNIDGYRVYKITRKEIVEDESQNVLVNYYVPMESVNPVDDDPDPEHPIQDPYFNLHPDNPVIHKPHGDQSGDGNQEEGKALSPAPYDPNPEGRDLAYRGPALNQAKKPAAEKPASLTIGGKEVSFSLYDISCADLLDAADREAFLASYEAVKQVRDKVVKYFFWLMPTGVTLTDGQTAEFSFFCEGEGVQATMNGVPAAVIAGAEPEAYIATLTEFGALAILCDA